MTLPACGKGARLTEPKAKLVAAGWACAEVRGMSCVLKAPRSPTPNPSRKREGAPSLLPSRLRGTAGVAQP